MTEKEEEMAETPMEKIGEDIDGRPVYLAKAGEQYTEPGVWVWDEEQKRHLAVIRFRDPKSEGG
jgi:hypothetical protein